MWLFGQELEDHRVAFADRSLSFGREESLGFAFFRALGLLHHVSFARLIMVLLFDMSETLGKIALHLFCGALCMFAYIMVPRHCIIFLAAAARLWLRVTHLGGNRRRLCSASKQLRCFWKNWALQPPAFRALQVPPLASPVGTTADSMASGDSFAMGGYVKLPSGRNLWFS